MGDGPSFDDARNEIPEFGAMAMNGHRADLADVLTFAPPRAYLGSDGDLDGLPDLDDGDGRSDVINVPLSAPPAPAVVPPPAWQRPPSTVDLRPDGRPRIVASWLRSPQEVYGRGRQKWTDTHYRARYHGARAVPYWWALVCLAPRGLKESARLWLWYLKSRDVDAKVNKIAEQKQDQALAEGFRPAWWVTWFVRPGLVVGATVVALVVYLDLGWVPKLVVAAVALPWLGWHFRPDPDVPVLGHPGDGPIEAPIPTTSFLADCFADLGIGKLTQRIRSQGDGAIHWIQPPVQVLDVDGEHIGWETHFKLPGGVTWQALAAKRDELAGLMDRDEVDVFVERYTGSEVTSPSQVELFVRKPATSKIVAWQPAPGYQRSAFDPFPIGFDERGRTVWGRMFTDAGSLMWLVGGQPGSGKSNGARAIAGHLCQDPFWEPVVVDGKGSRDLLALKPLCEPGNYVSNTSVDAMFRDALRVIEGVLKDIERRGNKLAEVAADPKLPTASKVTEEISRLRLGLHPKTLFIEEFQRLFGYSYLNENDKRVNAGKELETIVTRIAEIARFVQVSLVLSAQRPSAENLATNLRELLQIGVAFSVKDPASAKMILGSVAEAGADPTKITEDQKGLSIVVGFAGGARMVQWPMVADEPDVLDEVVAKCVRIRRDLALLAEAVDEEAEVDTRVAVVYHVAEVMEGETWLAGEVVADKLACRWPDRYPGWSSTEVTNALNAAAEVLEVEGEWRGSTRRRSGRGQVRGYESGDVDMLVLAADRHQLGRGSA